MLARPRLLDAHGERGIDHQSRRRRARTAQPVITQAILFAKRFTQFPARPPRIVSDVEDRRLWALAAELLSLAKRACLSYRGSFRTACSPF